MFYISRRNTAAILADTLYQLTKEVELRYSASDIWNVIDKTAGLLLGFGPDAADLVVIAH
jgi:hypothetical protein